MKNIKNFKAKNEKEIIEILEKLTEGEKILLYEDYERFAQISFILNSDNTTSGYLFEYTRRDEIVSRQAFALKAITESQEFKNTLSWILKEV